MAVQGAIWPLVSLQDEGQVRRKGGAVMLRDQGRKAVVPHEPVQGREVFFLKQFRHVHSYNSPLDKWPHVQPGILIRRALAQVRIAVRAEHVERTAREILRPGAMSLHHHHARQDVCGKTRVQPHHTGVIKEFDGLALTDNSWRSLVRMQTYPGASLITT